MINLGLGKRKKKKKVKNSTVVCRWFGLYAVGLDCLAVQPWIKKQTCQKQLSKPKE